MHQRITDLIRNGANLPRRHADMIHEPDDKRLQIGALPYFIGSDGQVRVVLVTTRETRRWSIPKGNPMRGKKSHKAAEIEAFEEAGVRGRIGHHAIGSYSYRKQFRSGHDQAIVEVFPLEVQKRAKKFPEKGERTVSDFSVDEAVRLVECAELSSILLQFSATRT